MLQQLIDLQTHTHIVLFIRSKIQFFESKSQLPKAAFRSYSCCLSDQRYNFLKANHNISRFVWVNDRVVYQIKDTIFWKQITTLQNKWCCRKSCLSDQRYNFLKANHNENPIVNFCIGVVYQIKDTIFWKQITTHRQFAGKHTGCLSDQRYNFLKANHN